MSQQLALVPNLATPAQVNFINSLRAQRALFALTSEELATLDKRGASREIDRLKALPVAVPTPNVVARVGYLDGIPASKYSVVEDGVRTFWEVKTWQGRAYIRLLVGAPGDFNRVKVGFDRAQRVAAELKLDVLGAAQAFAKFHTCCAVCGADLSDETSVALGLGPICRRRFGL